MKGKKHIVIIIFRMAYQKPQKTLSLNSKKNWKKYHRDNSNNSISMVARRSGRYDAKATDPNASSVMIQSSRIMDFNERGDGHDEIEGDPMHLDEVPAIL